MKKEFLNVLFWRGESDPLVAHVVDGVELAEEDVSQDPGESSGQVQAHDTANTLSHAKLGHLGEKTKQKKFQWLRLRKNGSKVIRKDAMCYKQN